jgi:hypothetical protein
MRMRVEQLKSGNLIADDLDPRLDQRANLHPRIRTMNGA